MKKIIRPLLCMLILNICAQNSLVMSIHANQEDMLIQYGIYDKTQNSNVYVTRGEALVAILRLAGMTSEMARVAREAYYYGIIYKDVSEINPKSGYIYEGDVLSKGTDFQKFEPERNITLSETITFMVRCLNKNIEIELLEAMKLGLERGIILKSDTFYSQNGNNNLLPSEFAVLLNRMLIQPKGYIWGNGKLFSNRFPDYYPGIPDVDYNSIETYQDNFEKRNMLFENKKEVIITQKFSKFFPKLKNLYEELSQHWYEPIYLSGYTYGIEWYAEHTKYIGNIEESYESSPKYESMQKIEQCLKDLSYNFLEESYYGYIQNENDIFILSNNYELCYGIIFNRNNSDERIRSEINFLKTLIPLSEQGWYFFDTYKR